MNKLPAGWQAKTVKDVCTLQNGNGFKPSEWSNTGLPIIRIQNLNGSKDFNYFSGKPKSNWLISPGEILFAWAGTKGVSFGPFIWTGPQGVLNQHIFRTTPSDAVDKDWLYYSLKQLTFEIEGKAHGFKATLLHVSKGDIEGQKLPVPPRHEQVQIAKVLSTWDKAIATAERLLANSQQQKQALMQQLLTGQKRFAGFSGSWDTQKLSEISTRIQRKSDGEEHPILTISSLSGFVTQEDKYSRYMAGESVNNYIQLNQGEFAYNKGNSKTYQYGCIFKLDTFATGLVPHVYVCFKLNQGFDPKYYAQLFAADYLKDQLAGLVNTGVRNNGLLNIKPSAFLDTTVPVPPLAEQQKIAQVLATADAEISNLQAQLAKLKLEKKALMQQLLTGQRRVRLDDEVEETQIRRVG